MCQGFPRKAELQVRLRDRIQDAVRRPSLWVDWLLRNGSLLASNLLMIFQLRSRIGHNFWYLWKKTSIWEGTCNGESTFFRKWIVHSLSEIACYGSERVFSFFCFSVHFQCTWESLSSLAYNKLCTQQMCPSVKIFYGQTIRIMHNILLVLKILFSAELRIMVIVG